VLYLARSLSDHMILQLLPMSGLSGMPSVIPDILNSEPGLHLIIWEKGLSNRVTYSICSANLNKFSFKPAVRFQLTMELMHTRRK